jgi:hypothetical protein
MPTSAPGLCPRMIGSALLYLDYFDEEDDKKSLVKYWKAR